MKKKQIIIALFLIVLVLLYVVVMRSSGKEEVSGKTSVGPSEEAVLPQENVPVRKLEPDNPQDYGMIVFAPQDKPDNQVEWDKVIKETIGKIKSGTPNASWQAAQETIKEDPAKTKDKVKDLDKRIEEYETALRKNSDNAFLRKRIERLKILRSLAEELAPAAVSR